MRNWSALQIKVSYLVWNLFGGIDAVFNVIGFFLALLGLQATSQPYLRHFIIIPVQSCLVFNYAVVYAIRDNDNQKKILEMHRNIRGPKESKVITFNGQ